MKKLLIFTILIIFIGCKSKKEEQPEPPKQLLQQITEVQGIGKVLPEQGIINLTTNQSGVIKKVNVNSGDTIKKGETLLVLDNRKDELNVQQDNSKLNSQKFLIQSIKTTIRQKEITLENSKAQLRTSQRLLEKGAETQQNVNDLKNTVALNIQALQKSKDDLAVANAQLKELQDQKGLSQNNLSERVVKASQSGTILEVTAHKGDALSAFSPFGTFAPQGALVVEAEIDELFAPKVKVGQAAKINFIGYPEVVATGTVIWAMNSLSKKSLFSNQNGEKEDRIIRRVKVRIEKANTILLIGAKVNCTININNGNQ